MKTEEIIEELNEVISKLKIRIIYYQTENEKLKKTIKEMKKYIKQK